MTETFQTAKLSDVARHAGVGIATASRALNGASLVGERTRKRVLEAAQLLNYQPNRSAQALKGGRTGMIGMVIPRMSDVFFASCVEAVQSIALQNSSLLVVAITHDCTDRTLDAVRQLMQHKVDGLVLASSEYLTPAMVRSLRALPVPVVGIDAPLTKAGLPAVLIDNAQSAQLATEHLIGHGFKRIISIQVNPKLYTMKERWLGYERAMRRAKLQPEKSVISDRSEAEILLRSLLEAQHRVAFVAGNEITAKHLTRAAKDLGITMPKNFAMISFDDFELSDVVATPLTVIRQPMERIGQAAANLLFQRLKNAGEPSSSRAAQLTVIPAELVVRGSCGCRQLA